MNVHSQGNTPQAFEPVHHGHNHGHAHGHSHGMGHGQRAEQSSAANSTRASDMVNFGEAMPPQADAANAQQGPQSDQNIMQVILNALLLLVQLISSLFGGAGQGQPSNTMPTGSGSPSGVNAGNDMDAMNDETMPSDNDVAMSDSSEVEQEAQDPFDNARTGQVFESSKIPGLNVFAGDQDPQAAEILLKTLEGMYYKNPDLKDSVDSVIERDGDINFTVQDLAGNTGVHPKEGGNDNLVDIAAINERSILNQGIAQNNLEIEDRGPSIESDTIPGLSVFMGDQSPEDAQILMNTIEGNYYTDPDFKEHIDSVLAENGGEYNFTVVDDSQLPEGRDYSAEPNSNEAQISADWVNARGNVARAVVVNAGVEAGTEAFQDAVATSVDNL